jgi:hypothetical protein
MGGLLAAIATRSAERFRIGAALLEKAEERRLSKSLSTTPLDFIRNRSSTALFC